MRRPVKMICFMAIAYTFGVQDRGIVLLLALSGGTSRRTRTWQGRDPLPPLLPWLALHDGSLINLDGAPVCCATPILGEGVGWHNQKYSLKNSICYKIMAEELRQG